MEQIKVEIPQPHTWKYEIYIGENLLEELDTFVPPIKEGVRVAIITDSNVKSLYGEKLLDILKQFNERNMLFSFPAGEKNKNRKTKEALEDELLIAGYARDSLILALGGGVTGDLAGFIASTYYRGIPYYQLPTTIISMTDSAVGGKTGVDTIYGKNLIGTFYQPWGVIADTSTLKSLPDEEYFSGLAEVIKYALIMDKDFSLWLEDKSNEIINKAPEAVEYLIRRSCENKVKVVVEDEKESGLRKILNYGHTIGHALEVINDYKIKHGTAVAYGMIIEAIISQKLNLLTVDEVVIIKKLIKSLILDHIEEHPEFNIERLIAAVRYDKKVRKGKPEYVLLNGIGSVTEEITLPVEDSIVKESIKDFLAQKI